MELAQLMHGIAEVAIAKATAVHNEMESSMVSLAAWTKATTV